MTTPDYTMQEMEQHHLSIGEQAHTVKRIKEVIEIKRSQLGKTEKPFLDALTTYGGTVIDLIQKQEHGGQKEGEPLTYVVVLPGLSIQHKLYNLPPLFFSAIIETRHFVLW